LTAEPRPDARLEDTVLPAPAHLTRTLDQTVRQNPDRPVTVYGGWTRTAAQCADRVARLAGGLRRLGVAPGDRVGVLAANSDRYHELLLGIPWAGAAVAPLGPWWSTWEIRDALRHSGVAVLFVDDDSAPLVPALRAGWDGLESVVYCGDALPPEGFGDYEPLVAGAEAVPDARRSGDSVFGIFYTRRRNGVLSHTVVSHDELLGAAQRVLDAADGGLGARLLHAASFHHLPEVSMWAAGLIAEATHVLVPEFTAPAVLAAADWHGVTSLRLEPDMLRTLLDDPGLADHDLTRVRRILHEEPEIDGVLEARARQAFPNAGFAQLGGVGEPVLARAR
jgi:acyl-CoA synthetase (AMP-forming)/AMP-acid ligase II